MTVATWGQPDSTSQNTTLWGANVDGNMSILNRNGAAFAPSAQASPNMTVKLQAGHVFNGVTLTEVAAQNSGTITAPVSNPRIDRIVIDQNTGTISVVTGTPAGSPVPPAIPAGKCPVAQVALTSSTTSITNSIITDERDFSGLGGQSSQPPYGVSTNSGNAYLVTTSPSFASYQTGMHIFIKINAGNTGSATVNANSIGVLNCKDNFGVNLTSGTLLANSIYEFIYDGTNLVLLNNTTNSSGLTLIQSQTVSGVASVNFTSGINGTYQHYVIECLDVVMAISNDGLNINTSSNAGSSYDAGGTDYDYVLTSSQPGSIGAGGSSGTATPQITPGIYPSTAGNAGNVYVDLADPSNTTTFKYFTVRGSGHDLGTVYNFSGTVSRRSTAIVNALKIFGGAGNITSGIFKLYGVKK